MGKPGAFLFIEIEVSKLYSLSMVKKPKEEKKKNSGNLKKMKKQRLEKEKLLATEEKLRVAVDQWRNIFDASKDAVSIINVEGSIIQCNKAMLELTSKPFPEILGQKCWELMHGTSEPIPGCPIVRMKKTLKRETFTLPRLHKV